MSGDRPAWNRFVPLLGTWQGTEQQHDSAYGPGGAARAILSLKFEVGAAIVVQDYRQVREDGAEFAGHGVFQPDGESVRWWFFDSTGVVAVPSVGGFDAAGSLSLTRTTPRGTAVHRWRLDGDELTYAIAVGAPGLEPVAFLAGRYRRVDTH